MPTTSPPEKSCQIVWSQEYNDIPRHPKKDLSQVLSPNKGCTTVIQQFLRLVNKHEPRSTEVEIY